MAMCSVKMGVATTGRRNPRNRTSPAAIEDNDDGRPTIECIQPNRNPHRGPNPRRKYAYSPPASGIAAPNSANDSAPNKERIAPTIHAAKTTETNLPSRAISAGFRKIPVPIIVPTTIAADAQAPSPRTNSSRFAFTTMSGVALPKPPPPVLLGSPYAYALSLNLFRCHQSTHYRPDRKCRNGS